MDPIEDIRKLKAKVLKRRRYRDLAEQTGLSESFLQKFATSDKTNYHTRPIVILAAFFSRRKATPDQAPASAEHGHP